MDGSMRDRRATLRTQQEGWSGQPRHGVVPIGTAAQRGDAGRHGGNDDAFVTLARGIIATRRALGEGLDPALFANPGLDIMLYLFAEGARGDGVTTNACCGAASVPRTTALRWIKLLADRGLVTSSGDASDRRVTMLHLTDNGRAHIGAWLAQAEITLAPRPDTPAR